MRHAKVVGVGLGPCARLVGSLPDLVAVDVGGADLRDGVARNHQVMPHARCGRNVVGGLEGCAVAVADADLAACHQAEARALVPVGACVAEDHRVRAWRGFPLRPALEGEGGLRLNLLGRAVGCLDPLGGGGVEGAGRADDAGVCGLRPSAVAVARLERPVEVGAALLVEGPRERVGRRGEGRHDRAARLGRGVAPEDEDLRGVRQLRDADDELARPIRIPGGDLARKLDAVRGGEPHVRAAREGAGGVGEAPVAVRESDERGEIRLRCLRRIAGE